MTKLFAVYLGGRAPRGKTELHDLAFVTGDTIEATYEQLMDQWFGTPRGLHLDSWMELDVIDGYKITLATQKQPAEHQLYFINLGAYTEGVFGEFHASKFIVAASAAEAKARGKALLRDALPQPAHTDDLFELDDCIEIGAVGKFHVALTKTDQPEILAPTNGYHLVPKDVVEAYCARKGL